MVGLERVYDDLLLIRKRIVRLIELERIDEETGLDLINDIFGLMRKVEEIIGREEKVGIT